MPHKNDYKIHRAITMTVLPKHWQLIVASSLFSLSNARYRIPLTRVKIMRKTHSKKHMLNNFLKEHAYRLNLTSSPGSNITTHPLRNIKDVSILGGWCSTEPPFALAQHWGSSGGARWDAWTGAPEGGRNSGEQDPIPRRRRHSNPQILVCGDWAQQWPGGK